MFEIQTTFAGNIGADPVFHETPKGRATRIRVAASRRTWRADIQQFVDDDPTWVDVVCFGSLARNAHMSLRKGHPVVVHGRLRSTRWVTDKGETRYGFEVIAEHLGPDLRRGVSLFTKNHDLFQAEQDKSEAATHDDHPNRSTSPHDTEQYAVSTVNESVDTNERDEDAEYDQHVFAP